MQNRRDFLNAQRRRAAPPAGFWLHVNRAAMACRFEVTLPISDEAGIAAARNALDEVDRIEAQLTVFRESSEVSHINRNAARAPIQVDRSLFALLCRCRELHRETEGAFDITAGPLTRVWGFLKREGRLPDASEIEWARARVGSEKLRLDLDARSIEFTGPGL